MHGLLAVAHGDVLEALIEKRRHHSFYFRDIYVVKKMALQVWKRSKTFAVNLYLIGCL